MAAFNVAPDPSYLGDDPYDPTYNLLLHNRNPFAPDTPPASTPVDAPTVAAPPVDPNAAASIFNALGPPPTAAPPDPTGSITSYSDALSKLQQAYGDRPQMSHPKWWQQLAGGAAGFGAGWSNAAGRTRNPINIEALRDNILHPGYTQKLSEWQSRLAPLQAQAELEGQRQQLETEQAYRNAQAEQLRQHGLYWAHRAQMEQNQWKLDPKTGTLYNTLTGERSSAPADPAQIFNQRLATAKAANFDDDKAQYYAATGSLTGYGSTLANPDKPGIVLPAGAEYLDPNTGAVRRSNPKPVSGSSGDSDLPTATANSFGGLEDRKARDLAAIEADTAKQIAALGPAPDQTEVNAIYAANTKRKQAVQNAYEGGIRARGGTVQHVEYSAGQTTPPAPTTAAAPAKPSAPPAYTEADIRKAALARGKNPDAAVALARQRKMIP